MREVILDASSWTNPINLDTALREALGAPHWHGNSFDAWIDSMIWGEINEVEAPYLLRITGTAGCTRELRNHLQDFADSIQKARKERTETRGEEWDVFVRIEP
jgi:hypothetical protein